MIHLLLHLAVPALVAKIAYGKKWIFALTIMMLTILVDLDHLLATPIYDPMRCSIGFHPLHTWPAHLFYLCLLAHPRSRLVGLGLVIHMLLDGSDCLELSSVWI